MTEYNTYGLCSGITDKIEPHKFYDGKRHVEGSHGLCYDCTVLTYHYSDMHSVLDEAQASRLEELLKKNDKH